MKKLIGLFLCASPFIALFGYITAVDGVLVALFVFGSVALTVGVIGLGVYLSLSD